MVPHESIGSCGQTLAAPIVCKLGYYMFCQRRHQNKSYRTWTCTGERVCAGVLIILPMAESSLVYSILGEKAKLRHFNIWSGADESADATLLLHESAGHRDLAVRPGRLYAGLVHTICYGALLAVRVEQSSPVPPGVWRRGESVFGFEQFLVHNRHIPATRLWPQSKGYNSILMTLKLCLLTGLGFNYIITSIWHAVSFV